MFTNHWDCFLGSRHQGFTTAWLKLCAVGITAAGPRRLTFSGRVSDCSGLAPGIRWWRTGAAAMDCLFAVLRSRGPAWDDSKPLEGQLDWAGHAAFMDALFEQRFAVLVGPLEGTRDALLIL